MLNNIRNTAYFDQLNGASGFLVTDWGDNGHWQQLPISYPGLAAAAEQAWNIQTELTSSNLAITLNKVVFNDKSEAIGQILLEMGDLYRAWGINLPNSSPLFWLLQLPKAQIMAFIPEIQTKIDESLDFLEEIKRKLTQLDIQRPDANLILEELTMTTRLLEHACKRAKIILGEDNYINLYANLHEIDNIKSGFASIWLRRNRPGGLPDSLNRFDTLSKEYQAADGPN